MEEISLPLRPLLHITGHSDWEAAQQQGTYQAPSLDTEGFIHLSGPEQVIATANRFYYGATGLVLLVIDADRLTAPVQYDAVPGHGTFPHLYGPLNLDAVLAALPFPPQADGTFALPALLTDTLPF